MSLVLVIYAIGVVQGITGFLIALAMLSSVVLALLALNAAIEWNVYGDSKEEKSKKTLTMVKGKIWIPVVCATISVLLPSKELSYQMLAGYGVQTLAENPAVQDLGKDGVDVLKALMAKAKKELETESK